MGRREKSIRIVSIEKGGGERRRMVGLGLHNSKSCRWKKGGMGRRSGGEGGTGRYRHRQDGSGDCQEGRMMEMNERKVEEVGGLYR